MCRRNSGKSICGTISRFVSYSDVCSQCVCEYFDFFTCLEIFRSQKKTHTRTLAHRYAYLIATVGFLAAQLFMMNRALMAGDYMTVLPTFQISWVLFSFSGGVAFFNDSLTDHQQTFLSMSLLLSILGIYMLAQRRMEFSKYRAKAFPFTSTVKRYENGSLRAVSPFRKSRKIIPDHDEAKIADDEKHLQYGSFVTRMSEDDLLLDDGERNGV